jgi:hypothetical protein
LVNERAIEPDISVFDKSARDDGTFARGDSNYNQEADNSEQKLPVEVCRTRTNDFVRNRTQNIQLNHGRICLPGVACTTCPGFGNLPIGQAVERNWFLLVFESKFHLRVRCARWLHVSKSLVARASRTVIY